jgi:hypothetical protein
MSTFFNDTDEIYDYFQKIRQTNNQCYVLFEYLWADTVLSAEINNQTAQPLAF